MDYFANFLIRITHTAIKYLSTKRKLKKKPIKEHFLFFLFSYIFTRLFFFSKLHFTFIIINLHISLPEAI